MKELDLSIGSKYFLERFFTQEKIRFLRKYYDLIEEEGVFIDRFNHEEHLSLIYLEDRNRLDYEEWCTNIKDILLELIFKEIDHKVKGTFEQKEGIALKIYNNIFQDKEV